MCFQPTVLCLEKKTQGKAESTAIAPTLSILHPYANLYDGDTAMKTQLHAGFPYTHRCRLSRQPSTHGARFEHPNLIRYQDSCTVTFLSRSNDPHHYGHITSTVHTPSCHSMCGPELYKTHRRVRHIHTLALRPLSLTMAPVMDGVAPGFHSLTPDS
jgi:hypothetical protein